MNQTCCTKLVPTLVPCQTLELQISCCGKPLPRTTQSQSLRANLSGDLRLGKPEIQRSLSYGEVEAPKEVNIDSDQLHNRPG